MLFRTTRSKLITAVTVIILIGFGITNYLNYRIAKSALRETIIHSSLPLTRDTIYSEIQRDIMRPVFVSSLMANDTFLIDWALGGEQYIDKVTRYLREIKEKYGFFTAFFISENSRNYYYHDGILKQVTVENEHDDWYFAFREMGVPYDIDIDTNEAADNAMTVFINHRLSDFDHNFLGATGVGLKMSRITNLLSVYEVTYDRSVFLVDANGLIQAHADNTLVNTANIRLMDGIQSVADKILEVRRNAEDFEYDRDGEHFLLTSRYIPELDWFLVVQQNQTESMESIRRNLLVNILWALVITALVVIMNVLTVNFFQNRLERVAMTDELSGAYNRRQFTTLFARLNSMFIRTGQKMSIILFDIDGFKKLNDTFGHSAGDKVIRRVADLSRAAIREHDCVIRWGGDEFMIVGLGGTDEVAIVAERINTSIAEDEDLQRIIRSRPFAGRITISCGIAGLRKGDNEESIVIRADQALYRAKAAGRDRMEIAPGDE